MNDYKEAGIGDIMVKDGFKDSVSWFTLDEAARFFNITADAMKKLTKAGSIEYIGSRHGIRFTVDGLLKFIDQRNAKG